MHKCFFCYGTVFYSLSDEWNCAVQSYGVLRPFHWTIYAVCAGCAVGGVAVFYSLSDVWNYVIQSYGVLRPVHWTIDTVYAGCAVGGVAVCGRRCGRKCCDGDLLRGVADFDLFYLGYWKAASAGEAQLCS